MYLSLDIDGLDSGIMPATGTPEPGGLSWQQATAWLSAVCARHQVLGLDLVELAPPGRPNRLGFHRRPPALPGPGPYL